jgi:threonine/homoserine/homoserine lactone efflux protein
MSELVVIVGTNFLIVLGITYFVFISLEARAARVLFTASDPQAERQFRKLEMPEEMLLDGFWHNPRYHRAVLSFFGQMLRTAIAAHIGVIVVSSLLIEQREASLILVAVFLADWFAARWAGKRHLRLIASKSKDKEATS